MSQYPLAFRSMEMFTPLCLLRRHLPRKGGDRWARNLRADSSRARRFPRLHHLIGFWQVGRLSVLAFLNQPMSPKVPTPGKSNTSCFFDRLSEPYSLSTLVRSPEIWFDVPSSRMTMFLATTRPSTIARIREKRGGGNQRGRDALFCSKPQAWAYFSGNLCPVRAAVPACRSSARWRHAGTFHAARSPRCDRKAFAMTDARRHPPRQNAFPA